MCTSPNYMVFTGIKGDGKERFTFLGHSKYVELVDRNLPFVEVPCQKCMECRIRYSQVWADRCQMESTLHKYNWFVTLTYSDEFLPDNMSVNKKVFQNFIKFLRKLIKQKIRYFGCMEYGDESRRPHAHLILFGCELNDLTKQFKTYEKGVLHDTYDASFTSSDKFYSPTIHKAWNYKGNITVQPYNYAYAAYVARYVTKKVDGLKKDDYYELGVEPEFVLSSRKPGIGGDYYEDEFMYSDRIMVGRTNGAGFSKCPRYFEKLFRKKYGDDFFFDTISSQRASNRRLRLINTSHKDKENHEHVNNFKDKLYKKRMTMKRSKI